MAYFIPNFFSGEKLSSQFFRYLQASAYVADIKRTVVDSAAISTGVIAATIALTGREQRRSFEDGAARIVGSVDAALSLLESQAEALRETVEWRLTLALDQQKLATVLSRNIAELLRIPDSEKQRQYFIEEGLRFFVNASINPELHVDALHYLTKALESKPQDYFVLHRLGLIHLYSSVASSFDPVKAEDLFRRAAIYAEVENDPRAMPLASLLSGNLDRPLADQTTDRNQIRLVAADSYFQAAKACFVLEKFADSAALARKALELGIGGLEAKYLIANSVARTGQSDQVARLLNEIISGEPAYALRAFADFPQLTELNAIVDRTSAALFGQVNEILARCRPLLVRHSAGAALFADVERLAGQSLAGIAEASKRLTRPIEVEGEPFSNLEEYIVDLRQRFDRVSRCLESLLRSCPNDPDVNRVFDEIEGLVQSPAVPQLAIAVGRLGFALEKQRCKAEEDIEKLHWRLQRVESKANGMRRVLSYVEGLALQREAERAAQDRKWLFRSNARISELDEQIRRHTKGDLELYRTKTAKATEKVGQWKHELEDKQSALAELDRQSQLLFDQPPSGQPSESATNAQTPDHSREILIKLGRASAETPVFVNLATLRNAVVVGTDQQQIDEFVSDLLLSLFHRVEPWQVRWVIFDSDSERLRSLVQTPHCIVPLVTANKARFALTWVLQEAATRATIMTNPVGSHHLFSTVLVVVTNPARILSEGGKEVRDLLQAILQSKPAVDIRCLFTFCPPFDDVLPEFISGFQTRIAFKLASAADSRAVLGMAGAEALSPREMLYLLPGEITPKRCTTDPISSEAWDRLTHFAKLAESWGSPPEQDSQSLDWDEHGFENSDEPLIRDQTL